MTILSQLTNDRRSTELHVDFTPVACILLDENVNPITFIYCNAPKENITEEKSNFTTFCIMTPLQALSLLNIITDLIARQRRSRRSRLHHTILSGSGCSGKTSVGG